jgi:hypothetical protein
VAPPPVCFTALGAARATPRAESRSRVRERGRHRAPRWGSTPRLPPEHTPLRARATPLSKQLAGGVAAWSDRAGGLLAPRARARGGGCWGAGAGPRAPTKLTMLGWDPIDAITDTCAQKAAPPASARGGARSARARLRAPSGACGRPRRGVCAGVCGGARLSDDVLDRTVHCARVLCQVVAHALHLRRPVAPRRASARRRSAHTARAAGAAVWRSAAGCDGARGGTELRPRRGALPVFRYPGARWRLHWSPGRANSPPQGGPCSSWFPGTLIPLTPARTRCGYPALLRPEGVVQVAERCAAQHLANHFSATVDLVRA